VVTDRISAVHAASARLVISRSRPNVSRNVIRKDARMTWLITNRCRGYPRAKRAAPVRGSASRGSMWYRLKSQYVT